MFISVLTLRGILVSPWLQISEIMIMDCDNEMTIEEAIKILNPDTGSCYLVEKYNDDNLTKVVVDALNVAIKCMRNCLLLEDDLK